MAVCRPKVGGGAGGGEAVLRQRPPSRTLACWPVPPGWLSGGEVGTLHGVEPVDGVPHAGLQGEPTSGRQEAGHEAGYEVSLPMSWKMESLAWRWGWAGTGSGRPAPGSRWGFWGPLALQAGWREGPDDCRLAGFGGAAGGGLRVPSHRREAGGAVLGLPGQAGGRAVLGHEGWGSLP